MSLRQRHDLLLSIYLSTRGFAFILAEGPLNPVDWGTSDHRSPQKNRKCLGAIEALVRRYRPDILILEDASHPSSHRSKRVRDLSGKICEFAYDFGIPVLRASREEVRKAFAPYGAETKDQIVHVIADRLPVLARYIPPHRKPWMSEDARMALFDAAAILLTVATRESDPNASS